MENRKYPKTFGRLRGKKRKSVIDNYKYLLNDLLFNQNIIKKEIILEIGSGNGENVIKLSKTFPRKLIVACEVYIDGNISLAKKINKKNIKNIKIYINSCFYFFEIIPNYSIDQVWILYPDPWPKKKHYKRKLISKIFLEILNNKVRKNGLVYIATDDKKYFLDILIKFYKLNSFTWINDKPHLWSLPFKNMSKTSFFNKAQQKGQKSNFMIFKKN